MAAVESLNHAELVTMIEADVRSADLESTSAAADHADTTATSRRDRRHRASTTAALPTSTAADRPSSSGASSINGYTMSETSSGGGVADSYDTRARKNDENHGDSRVRRQQREARDAQRAQRSMSTGFYSADDDADGLRAAGRTSRDVSTTVDELAAPRLQQITAL